MGTPTNKVAKALGHETLTVTQLAERTGLSQRSVTSTLSHLHRLGHVEFELNRDLSVTPVGGILAPGRTGRVHLTSEGRRIHLPASSHRVATPSREPRQLSRLTASPSATPSKKGLPVPDSVNPKVAGCSAAALIGVIVVCVFLSNSCTTVPPGHVGVKKSWAKVEPGTLANDWYFVMPWEEVIVCSTQSQRTSHQQAVNSGSAAVTNDTQTLGFSISATWSIDPTKVRELYLHYGDPTNWAFIVDSVMGPAFKTVSAHYALADLIRNREQVRSRFNEQLQLLLIEQLTRKDAALEGAIRIHQTTVDNLQYSREFEQAIELTMLAQQQILRQRNELALAQVREASRIVEAEATQQAEIARARGQALAVIIEFEAELTRLANLVQLGVNANLIYTWDRIGEVYARWNGELPKFTSGGDGLGLMMPLDMAAGESSFDPARIQVMLGEVRQRREQLEQAMTEEARRLQQERDTMLRDTAGEAREPSVVTPQTTASE